VCEQRRALYGTPISELHAVIHEQPRDATAEHVKEAISQFESDFGVFQLELKKGETVVLDSTVPGHAKGTWGTFDGVRRSKSKVTAIVRVGMNEVRIDRIETIMLVATEAAGVKQWKVRYYPILAGNCVTFAKSQGIQFLHGKYHARFDNVFDYGMVLVGLSRSGKVPSVDWGEDGDGDALSFLGKVTKFADPACVKFDQDCLQRSNDDCAYFAKHKKLPQKVSLLPPPSSSSSSSPFYYAAAAAPVGAR
jgi:hypothetical protein